MKRITIKRMDDNGNTFEVGEYPDRPAAQTALRKFPDGHKQTYWIDEEDVPEDGRK